MTPLTPPAPKPCAHWLAALICAAAVALAPFTAHAADLTVSIDNVADDAGQVLVALFDTAETFPKAMLRGEKVSATKRDAKGRVTVVFSGLAPGRYALSAFHDRDANGQLNSNMMGLPTEPYGFSRDARGNFGPPTFSDAALDLPEAGLTISLRVQ